CRRDRRFLALGRANATKATRLFRVALDRQSNRESGASPLDRRPQSAHQAREAWARESTLARARCVATSLLNKCQVAACAPWSNRQARATRPCDFSIWPLPAGTTGQNNRTLPL